MTFPNAATATADPAAGGGGWPAGLALAAMLLIAATVYAASCWWFPYANCWCCHGNGKHYRPDGRVLRLCRWCKGTGRRLRIGRRIYNHYAATRADATRGTRRGGNR